MCKVVATHRLLSLWGQSLLEGRSPCANAQALRLRAAERKERGGGVASGMANALRCHSSMTVASPSASTSVSASVSAFALARPLLFGRSITKVYRMGEIDVIALRGVDFDLYRGELVTLLGASGSGKSTLLNILGGLDVPTSGEVHYADHDLTCADDDLLTIYRREHVGFVFQFYNLIPSLTAQENVALVTDIADDPLDPADALDLVGLGDRLDHFPSQLSGGEQQRVAIARAVAKRPELLLCDEPTGALDFQTGRIVLEVLERVNQELGTATAIITHNAPIARMSDRIVTMSGGRIASVEHNTARIRASELSW
jgi:putative ABC transport system ATP-binding protein